MKIIAHRCCVPSEGRISVRESLRIFNKMELFIHRKECRSDKRSNSFENIVYDNSVISNISSGNDEKKSNKTFSFIDNSCGNTMKCFLSLFLNNKQIENTQLDFIMNGSPLFQIYNNLNIVLQNFQNFYIDNSFLNKHINHNKYNKCARKLCVNISNRNFNKLKFKLNEMTENKNLPIILLCSIVWTSSNIDYPINDHKFTIIKYNNNHYQLVQGYNKQIENNINCFGLYEWQNMNNKYSSVNGFTQIELIVFLIQLNSFINNKIFNINEYEEMFGNLLFLFVLL